MKATINPMHPINLSIRCKARSKRTGLRCRAPAVRGWSVCRMHGARGGAPTGARNGRFRHGQTTREAIRERRALTALLFEVRTSLRAISCEPVPHSGQ